MYQAVARVCFQLSVMNSPIRLPLPAVVVATIVLLASICLLTFDALDQYSAVDHSQNAALLDTSVRQLSDFIDNNDPLLSEPLAPMVASIDVQVDALTTKNNSVVALLTLRATEVVREVSADWKLLRKELLAVESASLSESSQAKAENTDGLRAALTEQVIVAAKPVDAENLQTLFIEVDTLAQSFEVIQTSINEGTRLTPLIDLVNLIAQTWRQANSANIELIDPLIEDQKRYADELLLLTGVSGQSALFGYYTSNQIIEYVQRVNALTVPESSVVSVVEPPTPVAPAAMVQAETSQPLNRAFIAETLASLQDSVSRLVISYSAGSGGNIIRWAGLLGLLASLLLLIGAISRMSLAADRLSVRPAAVATEPPVQSERGAMSIRQADALINDIGDIADGDLRNTIDISGEGHAAAVAEMVNHTSIKLADVVGTVRGAVDRIHSVAGNQQAKSRTLAELDIRRQAEAADLSESISQRSGVFKQHAELLAESIQLASQIRERAETTVNGANQISASIATTAAQVDVGVERLQRLVKTAASASEVTSKLGQLTEKTRLQTLNVSLKIPEFSHDEESRYDEFNHFAYASGSRADNTMELFEDIHQLTGKLVQIAKESEALIGGLQKEVTDTAHNLRQSSEELSKTAHHTLASNMLGKELSGYADQLSENVEKILQTIEAQQADLTRTARLVVQHDKTGNQYSELALAISQDLAGLKEVTAKVEQSVAGYKLPGDAPLE